MTRTMVRSAMPATQEQGIVTLLGSWIERRRQRQALAELNDRLLKDLGLTRADVEGESRKPFWQA